MIAKTREQVERLRTAGRLMAEVVEEVLALVRPGVSSLELEEAARRATLSRGARPSFLN
ncbi:MAG: Methionine aminopeptidase [Candidatus Adlerbacteria bacterium GW2011_GWA1_54_10]|nr:MAG: Methionine aminopeptidase [Candidatus Adlerbacteria bacterium GW2011_GWA1_54_10]